ncbi:hypothetical protein GCM10023224_33360 [Streptomonospora halophila]|uniref:Uncharacterized protein n=1 Tax=Streptomonospora halophila TaxID=427369 RepID=A0ABP9GLL1_9ACTN
MFPTDDGFAPRIAAPHERIEVRRRRWAREPLSVHRTLAPLRAVDRPPPRDVPADRASGPARVRRPLTCAVGARRKLPGRGNACHAGDLARNPAGLP